MVLRCDVCGAPLEVPAGTLVVRCVYCQSENRLLDPTLERAMTRSARLQVAADEAQRLASGLGTRGALLMAAFERESERALVHGDRAAAHAALQHMEGFVRLQYVPTLHFYRAMDPDDPRVVAALEQIDRVVDAALTSTAASLGIVYQAAHERIRSSS